MSDRREGEGRGEERLAAAAGATGGDRRARLLQMGAGAAFLVTAGVLVLIVVSASGGGGGDTRLEGVAAVDDLLAGIPQHGNVLGSPKAPVELFEFGDLQCPVCRYYSEAILPPIIEGRVKHGDVSIAFENFVIIGEESLPAGAAMLAAGEQGRAWSFLELFYRNQGRERSGYVTEAFVEAVGRGAGIPDLARWNESRKSEARASEVRATSEEAQRLGFTGTPSFAIEGPGSKGLEVLGTPESTGAIEAAIVKAG